MKKIKHEERVDTLRPEYNFDYSKAIHGKYRRELLMEGSNVIVLEPDIAKSFPDSTAVNEALRSLLEITNSTKSKKKKTSGSVIVTHSKHSKSYTFKQTGKTKLNSPGFTKGQSKTVGSLTLARNKHIKANI